MNFKKILKYVNEIYNQITFKIDEEDKEYCKITATISAEEYFDDNIYTKIELFDTGTVHVYFIFDHLDLTFENLKMVNDFNQNVPFFSACISELDGGYYLELHSFNASPLMEREISNFIDGVLNELLSDRTIEYLKPLARITYSDEDEEEAEDYPCDSNEKC